MGNVIKNFIDPLRSSFLFPRHIKDARDEEQFISTYVNHLKGQTDAVLIAASDHIAKTRTVRTFPLPAECLQACRDCVAAFGMTPPPKLKKPDYWTPELIELANKLCCCKLGKEAAEEGWLLGMHDFCRQYRRIPDWCEAGQVAAQSAALNADIKLLPKGSILAPLVKARKERYRKLAKLVKEAAV